MEAKLHIRFKKDKPYIFTAYILSRQYLNAVEDTEKEKALKRSKGYKDILNFLNEIEKQMGDAIREGRVKLLFDVYGDKTITFEMQGTKEEIDRWTHIGTAQKVALKTYLKPVMKVEVIK